jgi:hypothetical protein
VGSFSGISTEEALTLYVQLSTIPEGALFVRSLHHQLNFIMVSENCHFQVVGSAVW